MEHIVSFVDSETLPALASDSKTTRAAAVFRDVADGSFSLMPTTERHYVKFAKRDGYNVYFQNLFASSCQSHISPSCQSHISPHLKWKVWFAKVGDIGTLKGVC